MKTAGIWNFRSLVDKIMMGVVLAAMISSIGVAPAFGKDDHKRKGKHGNGFYEPRGRGYDRDRYRQRVYRPYGYRERVYIPPPVVYEPSPPPGISIFFPPIVIRP